MPASNVRIIARYPANRDPLLSGWLLGGDRIKGKAALVEVTIGKGRIILFGFRPQYRAQSLATYPLFFSAIRLTPGTLLRALGFANHHVAEKKHNLKASESIQEPDPYNIEFAPEVKVLKV